MRDTIKGWLVVAVIVLLFATLPFRIWAVWFGPCSKPVMEMPGWCLLLVGGEK